LVSAQVAWDAPLAEVADVSADDGGVRVVFRDPDRPASDADDSDDDVAPLDVGQVEASTAALYDGRAEKPRRRPRRAPRRASFRDKDARLAADVVRALGAFFGDGAAARASAPTSAPTLDADVLWLANPPTTTKAFGAPPDFGGTATKSSKRVALRGRAVYAYRPGDRTLAGLSVVVALADARAESVAAAAARGVDAPAALRPDEFDRAVRLRPPGAALATLRVAASTRAARVDAAHREVVLRFADARAAAAWLAALRAAAAPKRTPPDPAAAAAFAALDAPEAARAPLATFLRRALAAARDAPKPKPRGRPTHRAAALV
jgi:hypothetical protein